ncbi:MAG: DUF2835 domain-containing protein [Reinekea sp.]|jgi:hypothetical protein
MAAELHDNTLIVDIHIPAEEYLRHYQGSVTQVSCISRDGRKVRFPSRILQPFVTRQGIHGTFRIYFDQYHKFQRIEQL